MEVHVDRSWVGRTIEQIEAATGARVPFLFRLGAGMVPKSSTIFQDGDLAYAAVADAQLAEVEATLANLRRESERCGSRSPGLAMLAVRLPRSWWRTTRHPAHRPGSARDQGRVAADGRVVAGGRLRAASLEEAGIDTCDVAIAATGDDKVNLVVSLLCKTEFGYRAPSRGSTIPRTSGCSTRCGESTSQCQRPG